MMTNIDVAIASDDITLVDRVARRYINSKVGVDAPIWDREKAFNEWAVAEYDDHAWSEERRRCNEMRKIHSGLLRSVG